MTDFMSDMYEIHLYWSMIHAQGCSQ